MARETVWIINDYAGSPFHGMTYRHYYIAKELQKKAIKPIIISASYSHFMNNYPPIEEKPYLHEKVDMIEYLWLKVMKYRDSRDKKRIFKWFQFCFKLLAIPKHIDKPSTIICSGSAPMLILSAYYLAKKHKAKLIFEIRDIWPLTLMNLTGSSKYNPLIYIMQKSVNFGFKHSDHIISVLPYTDKYIKEQGIYNFNFTYLPNGIFLEELQNPVPLNSLAESQVPKDKFIIGYTGAMGEDDGLDILIDTASKLTNKSDIHFVFVGKGSAKEKLKKSVVDLNLSNITIIDPIPKREIQNMLALFDVCYIGWKDKEIYKYGISANKIFDYMYSAKPIIHLFSGNGDLISESKCGISIQKHESSAIKEAIIKLYNCSEKERKDMGHRGKLFVLKNHTYGEITDKIINLSSKKKEAKKEFLKQF